MLDTNCQPNSKTFLSSFRESFKGRHVSPTGFINWHALENAFGMMGASMEDKTEAEIKDIHPVNAKRLHDSLAVYNFITNKSPVIYLDKKLAKALFRTDVPEIKDPPKLPFKSFLVMVPDGLYKQGSGGEKLVCILIAETKLPDGTNVLAGHGLVYRKGMMFWHTTDLNWGEPTKGVQPRENAKKFGDKVTGIGNITIGAEFLNEVNDTAHAFYKNLILIYNMRPDLVYEEFFARPKKRSKTDSNRMPVRILGRDYTPGVQRCVGVNKNKDVNKGTVMQAHWRRGHYHTVCHGKNRQERTLKWFEPIYVNFDKD
jgi:hypothetical protein|tara:strand:+ start:44 stop:985 length:942 start_codon:yes stop_codon:yes gene_type:complete